MAKAKDKKSKISVCKRCGRYPAVCSSDGFCAEPKPYCLARQKSPYTLKNINKTRTKKALRRSTRKKTTAS